MSKFSTTFQQTAKQNRPAYIPFLMLGYPSLPLSLSVIDAVIAGGADALELGFPFSDPIADGPTVRQAASHALKQGVTTNDCFTLIDIIRKHYPEIPIGILVYANLVFRYGIDSFYAKAAEVGIDAVLVPDVPTIEAMPFIHAAKAHGIHPVLIASPTCQQQDLVTLSTHSEGYTYVVTRSGVTGTERQSELDSVEKTVSRLKTLNAPLPVFGFGIQNAQDVSQAFYKGAAGVIIGSALIQQISKMSFEIIKTRKAISQLTKKLFYGS